MTSISIKEDAPASNPDYTREKIAELLDTPATCWTPEQGKELARALEGAGISYTLLRGKDLNEEWCEVRYILKDREQRLLSKEAAKQAVINHLRQIEVLPPSIAPQATPDALPYAAPPTAPCVTPYPSPVNSSAGEPAPELPAATAIATLPAVYTAAPLSSFPGTDPEEETARIHSPRKQYGPLLGIGAVALLLATTSGDSFPTAPAAEMAISSSDKPAAPSTSRESHNDSNSFFPDVYASFRQPLRRQERPTALEAKVNTPFPSSSSSSSSSSRPILAPKETGPAEPYVVRYGDRLYALFRRWGIRRWQEWERCGDWTEDQGVMKSRHRIYPGDTLPDRRTLLKECPQYRRRH